MSAKRKTVKKKKKEKTLVSLVKYLRSEKGRFFIGVVIAFIAIYVFIGMVSFFFTGAQDQSKVLNKSFWDLIIHRQEIKNWTGVAGAFFAEQLINKYFGISTFVIPIFALLVGAKMMGIKVISLTKSFFLGAFALIWGSLLSSLVLNKLFPESHVIWGGSHGEVLERLLENSVGLIGVILILLLLMIIFVFIVKSGSINSFQNTFKNKHHTEPNSYQDADFDDIQSNSKNFKRRWALPAFSLKKFFVKKKEPSPLNRENKSSSREFDEEDSLDINRNEKDIATSKVEPVQLEDNFEIFVPKEEQTLPPTTQAQTRGNTSTEDRDTDSVLGDMEDFDPTKDLSGFSFPSSGLLKIYDTGSKGVDLEEQKANKEKIITTLSNYGIEITSIKATVGPTITLYEIVPQAGVRISKIKNLEDDIALSLSALGIRIIAPMPGKGTIGIEVPNKDPQIVSMQSVIASRKFQECNYDLPVALGKTITNEIFMFDLCKMPHLLVAGATGQGKSVGLNAIITSLLYKKHPAEMKMVLVDPKMVEFNIYSTIEKHYLAKLPDAEKAIITDVTKVTQTLNSLTKEMDDRYELLMAASVRNIKEYNEKFKKRRLNPLKGHKFLPYIVVIIDEFGDLIMTAGKEIELPIARIAQKARAVGIHMIIATQRPTTNIITGTIKANFPARMAFRVTSQIDSRTILDTSGANQLIGRGDMLFSQGSDMIRIQCAFVDTPEVEEITHYISNQQGYSDAFALPEYVGEVGNSDKPGSVDLNDRDSLFEEAARLIVVHQQGSTSLIQRKFSIGYNRAGRLMDQLEAAGIVGAAQGSKPRDVLIMDEYSLEQKLSSL